MRAYIRRERQDTFSTTRALALLLPRKQGQQREQMLSTKPVKNLGKDTRSVTTHSGITSMKQQVALVYLGTEHPQ